MAARNPGYEKQDFTRLFFPRSLFTVSPDGISERGTTRSISKGTRRNIAQHCLQKTLKYYAQFRWRSKQVSGEILGWYWKERSTKQTDCCDWIILDNQKKKMTDSTIYHTISRNAVADTSGETLKWARVNLDLTSPGQHKEKCSNFRGGQVVCDIKHCARSGTKWTCEVESNST